MDYKLEVNSLCSTKDEALCQFYASRLRDTDAYKKDFKLYATGHSGTYILTLPDPTANAGFPIVVSVDIATELLCSLLAGNFLY